MKFMDSEAQLVEQRQSGYEPPQADMPDAPKVAGSSPVAVPQLKPRPIWRGVDVS